MEIPNDVFEALLEQLRQIQISLRTVRAELGKWRQEPLRPTTPAETEEVEPPTEKQIVFLKGLGVQDIPGSKEEARQLLLELNAKREVGQYSIPPTEKQIKYLKDLKYTGPIPASKDEAWRLLQELRTGG